MPAKLPKKRRIRATLTRIPKAYYIFDMFFPLMAEGRIGTFALQAVYYSSVGCTLTYPQALLVLLNVLD
jgi:hypothetical protein